MKFYNLYVNKLISKEEIYIFIGVWRAEYQNKCQLHDFLGMTKEQYDKWVITKEIEII